MKHKIYKKVVLVILDGFGVAPKGRGNAIDQAKTPTLDFFVQNYPALTLQASGPLVGLPWGEMGNSEVGHLNIGAGRIVGLDLARITNDIRSGDFFKNQAFIKAIEHAKKHNSALHLVGLVSPGGVHSLDEHLYALLGLAEEKGLRSVYIHMFTDGRDTEPKVALDSLKKLRDKMAQTNVGKIATLTGRFYAMDRGGHWTQTKMTYEAMVEGKGEKAASAEECIKNNYQSQIFDEMIKPTVLAHEDGTPTAVVSDNDAVIFFNFRSDRALQLTQMFVDQSKVPQEFHCRMLQNLFFVSMTEYVSGLPVTIAYPSMDLSNNLAEVVSKAGMLQFHIAESEKYAHVTAFFNGGRSEKFPGEERVIVTSPENNSRNYVDHPEMSAKELTRVLTQKIEFGDANLFVANFANPDMVGHTGSLTAAIEAVECVDACLKEIYQAVMKVGGALVVTADHGNAEQMINKKSGGIDTDHTTNPVPFLIVGEEFQFEKPLDIDLLSLSAHVPAGVISDVAPTVLDLFGMKKPKEMTAVSLFEEIDEVPLKE